MTGPCCPAPAGLTYRSPSAPSSPRAFPLKVLFHFGSVQHPTLAPLQNYITASFSAPNSPVTCWGSLDFLRLMGHAFYTGGALPLTACSPRVTVYYWLHFAVFLAGLLCCTRTGDAVGTMVCAIHPPRVGQHKAPLPFPPKGNFIQAGAVAWICPNHCGQ